MLRGGLPQFPNAIYARPMSSLLSRARLRGPLHYMCTPGDEAQTWSREQLLEMNARFVAQLEQAFELGLESRASAAGQVKLPASSGARRSTPLCPSVWAALLRSTASGAIMAVARR
jgi:hypothetical protein